MLLMSRFKTLWFAPTSEFKTNSTAAALPKPKDDKSKSISMVFSVFFTVLRTSNTTE